MPTSVTRDIAAPRTRVWEVMADGWTYSQWVVGNSRMRAVDSDWPAVIDDETLVLSSTPQEELVLLARLGPFGAARITLRLADIPEGCRVEMAEVAVEGPMRFVPDRVQLAGIWPRNKECTWRLANLAEQRNPDEFD